MVTSQQLELLAPLSGVLMALDNVPDPVFASRLIGDGLCIDPTSQVLCAPLAGVISNLQHTGHAVSITGDNGVQVLLHIGLDTVSLGGKGFTPLVEEGQQVTAGQALIEFDADYIALHARSLLTLMLVVSGETFVPLGGGRDLIESGQPLLSLQLAQAETEAVTEDLTRAAHRSAPQEVPNANGLHARPAAVFAQAAKGFASTIHLHKQGDRANAKSLIAIMALQTVHGDSVYLSAAGDDAEQALKVLSELLASGCGETVSLMAVEPSPVVASEQTATDVLRGVCASPGSAFGHVVQLNESALQITEFGSDSSTESGHLKQGLADATVALQILCDNAPGKAQAEIFKAHQELLQDPDLLEQAFVLIEQGKSAAFAWQSATQATSTLFKSLGSHLLAERALDLEDVGQRVLKLMLGVQDCALELPDHAILIAEQLTPSQTASLDTRKVAGFATVGGGATSHVAILARALGLPAMCGMLPQVLALANGTPVLLDADRAALHLHPDPERIKQLTLQRARQYERQQRDLQQSALAACTHDGRHVEVSANIASLAEAEQAVALCAGPRLWPP